MAEYGSVARHIYSHASLPALLVPARAVHTHTRSALEHRVAEGLGAEQPHSTAAQVPPQTREPTPDEEREEVRQAALHAADWTASPTTRAQARVQAEQRELGIKHQREVRAALYAVLTHLAVEAFERMVLAGL